MSIVLSVYSSTAFQDYLLPAVNNTETRIRIDKTVFSLEETVTLSLEVISGEWFFRDPSMIFIGSMPYAGDPLGDKKSYCCRTPNGETVYILCEFRESVFEAYRKYELSGLDLLTIGRDDDSDLTYSTCIFGDAQIISKNHANLTRQGQEWFITDPNAGRSSNGIFVNNVRIRSGRKLFFGDRIDIWGLRMIYLGSVLAVMPCDMLRIKEGKLHPWQAEEELLPVKCDAGGVVSFRRSPRSMEELDTDTVEIEAPPAPREENEISAFSAIGPALTMMIPMMASSFFAIAAGRMTGSHGSAFMYTGLITAAFSGSIGAFWAARNVKNNKENARKEEARRFEAYSTYLTKCKEEIQEKYHKNTEILNRRYPSVEDVLRSGIERSPELWSRNRLHEDFLYHRLGTGNIPFQVKIDIPRERFSLINDSLSDNPAFIRNNFQTLYHVPVGMDLKKERIIGVIGGEGRKGAYPIVYSLCARLAVENCYTEVKMAFLTSSEEEGTPGRWDFALWLPHAWSPNRKARYVAMDREEASDVCYDLSIVLRERAEENQSYAKDRTFLPHYVVFVEDIRLIEDELVSRYLLDSDDDLGFTVILMAEKQSDLPNSCGCIVENTDEYQGIYHVKTGRDNGTPMTFDTVSENGLSRLSAVLANTVVSEKETGGEIPQAVTFFDMYGVSGPAELHAPERWRKNRTYENMKALIGLKSGGHPCWLDIHEKYHGPHGLVAGTTGSGKSETLQTYILSLALDYSPDDVGFFIIDYKGGGMGNLFTGLPHMLGQISNLSGSQIRRAMLSIKSENQRRQRIFNENGVNNINAYTKLYKNGEASVPVPHLLIIIDEFAELKREEPEFMKELISVAQVGRSLGVHLILSTQKPSGTVDDNIWSNSKFRLCLRVQDRQDSNDMLHKPDAAFITQAGRGYLQVGNDELYELFQSGWSGATYDETTGAVKRDIVVMITNSGRTGLAGNLTKTKRKADLRKKWVSLLLSGLGQDGSEEQENLSLLSGRICENNPDFQLNERNNRLVKNLYSLYREALSREELTDVDEISEYVIQTASQRGIRLPEARERTELDAMITYLARTFEEMGYVKQPPLWLPVLSESIPLSDLPGMQPDYFTGVEWSRKDTHSWELTAPAGLVDDPVNQEQMPLFVNFTQRGSMAVCGMSMSGKSTFIQTLLYSLLCSYSPEYLNLYILDFGNRMMEAFENDPHVGDVLYDTDLDTVGKFFHMLEKELETRKEAFRGGNFSQYTLKNGTGFPAWIIVIDNYAGFREKTNEKYDDRMLRITRECASKGIYFLISAQGYGIGDIPGKMAENIHENICFEMQDRFAYGDTLGTTQIQVLPDSGIPGRGLALVGETPLIFQACLALTADDDYGRMEKIGASIRSLSGSWTGRRAVPVPCIPKKPVWSAFTKEPGVQELNRTEDRIPYGYDLETADIVSVNLREAFCFAVSGKAKTGKTNLLRLLLRGAAQKKGKIVLVEFGQEELKAEICRPGDRYIGDITAFFDFVREELAPTIVERNRIKKELQFSGMEDGERFERMSEFDPYFIFFADLTEFAITVHKPENAQLNVCGAMSNFFDRGSQLNISYFAALKWERVSPALGKSVYDRFVQYRQGIFLGGEAENQNMFDFRGMSYSEISGANRTAGMGITAASDTENARRIVTPAARG